MSAGALMIDAYQCFPPVLGVDRVASDQFLIETVCGTAFPIGEHFYLTAGHVAKEALAHKNLGVGYVKEGRWKMVTASQIEIHDDKDIAIILCTVPDIKAVGWDLTDLPALQDVQTMGYPYALDATLGTIDMRAFKGYVISQTTFTGLKSKPRCYELSFFPPRGLSGAPLMYYKKDLKINGLIIGNKRTEMLVFSDKEIIKDEKETIVERYETTQYGVAVHAKEIVSIESKLLGMTIGAHLKKGELLPKE